VPVGQVVLNGVVRHLLPLALLVLGVAEAGLVKVDLAQIVQERGNGDALVGVADAVHLLHTGTRQNVAEAVIHVQAVLAQSALVVAVVAG